MTSTGLPTQVANQLNSDLNERVVPQHTVIQQHIPQNTMSQQHVHQQHIPQQTILQHTMPQAPIPQHRTLQQIMAQHTMLQHTIPQQLIGQQAIYPQQPHQFTSMSIPHMPAYMNAPAVSCYNNIHGPATNFVSSYQVPSGQHFSGYGSLSQPPVHAKPHYYHNAAMIHNPPQVTPATQNAVQTLPTANMPIPQPLPQHGSQNTKLSSTVPMIDLSTGRDKFNEMCQQQQNKDEVSVVEEFDNPPNHELVQVYQLPPQAVQLRIYVVQANKLQPATKEYITGSLANEVTPVASAINDVVETSITNKSSEDGKKPKRPRFLKRKQQRDSHDTKEQVQDALSVNKNVSISGNFNNEEIEQKDLMVNLLTNKDIPENSQCDESKEKKDQIEAKISVSVNLTEEDVTDSTSVIQSSIPNLDYQFAAINNNTTTSEPKCTKSEIIIGVANKPKRTRIRKKQVVATNATTLPVTTITTPDLHYFNTNHVRAPWNVLKVYTREVLLAMSKDPANLKKPDNLPGDILKKDYGNNSTVLAPNFCNNSFPNKLSLQHDNPLGSIGKGEGLINDKPPLGYNQASGNARNRARFPASGELNEDEKKTAELYKRFNEILNKLTPEKFDALKTEVQDLNIDTSERLQGIIDLVFEKAAEDPKLGSAYLYSSLCGELAVLQVPLHSEGQEEFVNFKNLLVTRCQAEFEKSNAYEILKSSKVYEIENCFDFDKRKELQTELEEYKCQCKRKYVGIIKFMGELFKKKMISIRIILRCLKELLHDKSEESLECLCTLLAIAGELLNKTKQSDLNMILKEMRDIVERRPTGISNRIRFMLRDNIELLIGDWVVLRNLEVDEIENSDDSDMNKELIIKLEDKLIKKSDGTIEFIDSTTPTISVENCRTQQSFSETTPVKELDKLSNYNNNIRTAGNGEVGSILEQAIMLEETCTSNSSDILMHPSDRQYSESVEKTRRKLEQCHDKQQLISVALDCMQAEIDRIKSEHEDYIKNNFEAHNNLKSETGKKQLHSSSETLNSEEFFSTWSGGSKPNIETGPAIPSPVEVNAFNVSNTICENDSISCLPPIQSTGAESVPSQQGIPEAILSKTVSADTDFEDVTIHDTYIFINVINRSRNERLKRGKLYGIPIGNGTVQRNYFYERLQYAVSKAKNLTIEVRKFWIILARYVSPYMIENCITLNDLSALLDEESKNEFGSKFLASLFRAIIINIGDEKGHALIGQLLRDSNTKLSNFMPESQINKFIEENKFYFLNAPQPRISMDLLKRLSKMFADNTTFEDITNWISKDIGDDMQENQFIRTLATAIFDFSIVDEKINDAILTEKYCFFIRYVNNNLNFELQCLFALQSVINKLEHPQGILLNICSKLYKDTIFSRESFLAWEANSDPLEQEGKGITMKQLMAFFVDLKDNEYELASEASEQQQY